MKRKQESLFQEALRLSQENKSEHPSIDVDWNVLAELNFDLHAVELARRGLYLERCNMGSWRKGFVPNSMPDVPSIDHPYRIKSIVDSRKHRTIAVISECYRQLDAAFRSELDGWSADTGMFWTQWWGVIHAAGHPTDKTSILIRRQKQPLIPLLPLSRKDFLEALMRDHALLKSEDRIFTAALNCIERCLGREARLRAEKDGWHSLEDLRGPLPQ